MNVGLRAAMVTAVIAGVVGILGTAVTVSLALATSTPFWLFIGYLVLTFVFAVLLILASAALLAVWVFRSAALVVRWWKGGENAGRRT